MLVTGFVQAHAQVPPAKNAQVDVRGFSAFDDGRLGTAYIQGEGVEEMLVEPLDAFGFQASRQDEGQPVHTLGDALQAFRAVIHRVEAGNVGQ